MCSIIQYILLLMRYVSYFAMPEYGVPYIKVLEYNKGVAHMSQKTVITSNLKHTDVDHHFESDNFSGRYSRTTPSVRVPACAFKTTKPLTKDSVLFHRNCLRNHLEKRGKHEKVENTEQ